MLTRLLYELKGENFSDIGGRMPSSPEDYFQTPTRGRGDTKKRLGTFANLRGKPLSPLQGLKFSYDEPGAAFADSLALGYYLSGFQPCAKFDQILARHGLLAKWEQFGHKFLEGNQ